MTPIRLARMGADIPVAELAKMLGVSRAFVYQMETGTRPLPEDKLVLLPPELRRPVIRDLIARHRAEIARLREMLR